MAILILFSLYIRKAKKKKKRRKKIFLCQTKGGSFCFFHLGFRNTEKKILKIKLVYVLLKQLVNKLWLTISMWNFPRLLYL